MLQLIKAMMLALRPIDHFLIEEDPVMSAVFIGGDTGGAGTAFYNLYTRGRDIVVRNAFLRDPAFLVQLQDALVQQYGEYATSNVWELAGVQKHNVINGSLRPVREWRK